MTVETTPPERTALLVMDMQRRILANFPNDPALPDRVANAMTAARRAGIKVIHVVAGQREAGVGVSKRNLFFTRLAGVGGFGPSDSEAAIHPALTVAEGEQVVLKRRVSGFAGSDLELLLRSNDIESLVLSGVATSGVVLSTWCQASDLDYRLQVLSDGCTDRDEDIHRVLTEKVFPRQATVLTIAEWVAILGS